MAYEQIVTGIDAEISRLQQVRALLTELDGIQSTPAKRGRPKGSDGKVSTPVTAKRTMSADGKARIAEAQRKRWAAKKRADRKTAKEAGQPE